MKARPLPLLLLLFPLLAAEPPKMSPPPVERSEVEVNDPKLKASIDDAIKRGVAWLKARQLSSGAWPASDNKMPPYPGGSGRVHDYQQELSALALLALLKCGVPPSDTCVSKGLTWLQKQECNVSAYSPAICLLVLDAKYTPKEAVAKPGKKAPKPEPIVPSKEDLAWAIKLTNQLTGSQARNGGWRYHSVPTDMEGGKPGIGDVSCTQYALMGLKTAKRLGIPVKPEAFGRALDFLLDQQEADGKSWTRITRRKEGEEDDAGGYADKARGWPYMKGAANAHEAMASGGMTCAGVVGILICRSEILEAKDFPDRAKRQPKAEQSMWDGLAWLDANWSTVQNPAHGNYELGYYLYALERVGVMADLRMIGPGHDWYVQGAQTWMDKLNQDPADIAATLGSSALPREIAEMGFWGFSQCRPKAETQDTPYALLFLRKASIRLGYAVE